MIPCMIVPILVGPDILRRMLDTIDYPIKKLIIIDNGDALRASSGWPVEHVQSTKVIKMPANLGVAGSWNLGIKATPFAPWWLITNFDVEWPAGSLRRFAEQASGADILLAQSAQPWSAAIWLTLRKAIAIATQPAAKPCYPCASCASCASCAIFGPFGACCVCCRIW